MPQRPTLVQRIAEIFIIGENEAGPRKRKSHRASFGNELTLLVNDTIPKPLGLEVDNELRNSALSNTYTNAESADEAKQLHRIDDDKCYTVTKRTTDNLPGILEEGIS
jgi:hypothetical protein